MEKNKNSHLTQSQRNTIHSGLMNGKSFKQIGKEIGKDCTTVSREVRRHIVTEKTGSFGSRFNDCVHRANCKLVEGCEKADCMRSSCRNCSTTCCTSRCRLYERKECPKLQKPPYVCMGCSIKQKCTLEKHMYDSQTAQKEYKELLSGAREGFAIQSDEQESIGKLLKDGLSRGLSVHAIVASEGEDAIGYSEKAIYKYIDAGVFEGVGNYLHPRQVRYRKRRKNEGRSLKVDKRCHEGRSYEDYLAFMRENPDVPVVQMDSVEGIKGPDQKVLLTIHFTECKLMLALIRPANTARSVAGMFQMLRNILGTDDFKRLFPVILTDRGTEFSNPEAIEVDFHTGELLTRIFYCDPRRSDQKGCCENNHEMIRRIIPQGISLNPFSQEQISLMMNHINSYPRKSIGDKTPYQTFSFMYGNEVLKKLGLVEIPNTDLCLKPSLLKK